MGIIRKSGGNLQEEKGFFFGPSGQQAARFFLGDQRPGQLALLAQLVVSPGLGTIDLRRALQISCVQGAWTDASLFA